MFFRKPFWIQRFYAVERNIIMAVLVTGGAGYIGSHTCVELLNAGEDIIVIDNFYNSKPKAIEAIKEITGRDFRFYENDCCDREALDRISERTSSQK